MRSLIAEIAFFLKTLGTRGTGRSHAISSFLTEIAPITTTRVVPSVAHAPRNSAGVGTWKKLDIGEPIAITFIAKMNGLRGALLKAHQYLLLTKNRSTQLTWSSTWQSNVRSGL